MSTLSRLTTEELKSKYAELRCMWRKTESESFRQELLYRMEKYDRELRQRDQGVENGSF